jgi:TonB family protein
MSGEPLAYDHGRALEGEAVLDTTWRDDKQWIRAWAQRDRDGRRLADVRASCAELTVVVPADRMPTPAELAAAAPGLASAGILGMLSGGGGSATVWRIAEGKDVRWRDGSIAGLVARTHEFTSAPTSVDGRKCFAIAPAGDATIELCFAADDVQEIAGSEVAFGRVLGGADEGDIWGGLIGVPLDEGAGGPGGGGLGLGALGSGAYGRRKSGRTPGVRAGSHSVTGALDKDIIRRIVRAHINEVRFCYDKGLAKDPALKGKVSVQFTIGASGSVASSSLKDSTVTDADVADCIVKAVRRWKFPKPEGGGIVNVTYPFVLSST